MSEPPLPQQPDIQPPGWQPPQPAQPKDPLQQPPSQPAWNPQPRQPPQQGPAWIAPPKPPPGGRGSIWLGIAITFGALLAWWGITTAVPSDNPVASMMNSLILLLPFGLVLAGIVLAAIPRTTRTGAGILIGIGAGILILGGLCVVLLAGFNA
ncbi:MAG: hypothetical protein ACOH1Y_10625 [Propionicimonas sp.]